MALALLLSNSKSALKAGCRRRLVISSRDSRRMMVTDGTSFWWQRGSCLGSTSRSIVTSLRDQDNEDEQRNAQRIHHPLQLPLPSSSFQQSTNSTLLGGNTLDFGSVEQLHLITTTTTTTSSSNRHRLGAPIRYVHPPSSIRSTNNFLSLVAQDRAATALAIRVLNTWAFSHYSSYSQHSHPAVVFFSTKSDGSRAPDPRIVKGGIRKIKIPTPPSGPQQQSMKPEDIVEEIKKKNKTVVVPALVSGLQAVLKFILALPKNLFFYMTNPSEIKEWWNRMKKIIKDEIDHYWVGSKLLWADLKTARNLIRRTLRGSSLTRRERKQLLRTISDLFRLIPFSMFLIIPLMEFALPFALKIFPNLLPSTFQDSLKAEENMKRELQGRIAMAKFFQETLEELAKEQKLSASHLKKEIKEHGDGANANFDESVVAQQEASAASFLEFMEKARRGEPMPNDVIVRYAHLFRDDLTLDNMPRMQLINMCKYMGIAPYGSDSFLRFQLRHRMRLVQEDDQRILWEGIDSLTKMELREACQERGMRSTGLSKDAYKRALQQWLDLSVKQNVPTSLLIMSRVFFLREEMFEHDSDESSKSLAGLADAISGLDKEVVNEVILDVATSQEKMSDPGVRKIKLEVLMKQNELIEKEQMEREEAAAKKKEQADKEKKGAESEIPIEPNEEKLQFEINGTASQTDTTSASTGERPSPVKSEAASDVAEAPKEAKKDEDLSAAEMDAISQLVSADPVSRERADLESIKAALQDEKKSTAAEVDKAESQDDKAETIAMDKADPQPTTVHLKESSKIEYAKEELADVPKQSAGKVEVEEVVEEDPIVAKLKKRLESMVDKIEVQLSDVQVKIGDKLHMLDRDMDGILSVEEIAEALQQVLKRKISYEEAKEIAQQMDANKDGDLTVQELIEWVEKEQLVKFVEEGRDHDMDRIIEKQTTAESQEPKEEQEVKPIESKK